MLLLLPRLVFFKEKYPIMGEGQMRNNAIYTALAI